MDLYARLKSRAVKEGIDLASVPNTPTREADLPSVGGCLVESGHRCAHGWHWRPIDPNGIRFTITDEDPNRNDLDVLTYSGKMVATERCPAYCEAAGWVINPSDKTKIWASSSDKKASNARKALAE